MEDEKNPSSEILNCFLVVDIYFFASLSRQLCLYTIREKIELFIFTFYFVKENAI